MNNDEEKIDTEYFNFLPQWIYFGVRYSAQLQWPGISFSGCKLLLEF